MPRLAREMNLSETVFTLAPEQGGDARIRIFTPGTELPFAGHPVLGAAFVLGGDRDVVRLETGLGIVPVALERDGEEIVFGRMQQPIPAIEVFEHGAELLRALGVARSVLPIESYLNGPHNVLVMLEDEDAVAALAPDHHALAALGALNVSCFAGPAAAGRRGCSRRRSASPRIRRPDPRPGRSRCTSRATARSTSARRSRSPRARRSGGRRSSTRASRARRRTSTRSRSAAPR